MAESFDMQAALGKNRERLKRLSEVETELSQVRALLLDAPMNERPGLLEQRGALIIEADSLREEIATLELAIEAKETAQAEAELEEKQAALQKINDKLKAVRRSYDAPLRAKREWWNKTGRNVSFSLETTAEYERAEATIVNLKMQALQLQKQQHAASLEVTAAMEKLHDLQERVNVS